MAANFKFVEFSKKQKQVLTWWTDVSPHKDKAGIICDGSIRAGKTKSMGLSFVLWAMNTFNGYNFGMAGKTIASFKRNVWIDLLPTLKRRGYKIGKVPEMHDAYTIRKGATINYFYIFGGHDEQSQSLVQGITCAGFFFDEVALMPESFVNQATGRCSIEDSKLWFNCNPEGPNHWFKIEWIDQKDAKELLHIHFEMDDNPSLSEKVKAMYRKRYRGVFFARFIQGLWVLAEGVIYSMFNASYIINEVPPGVRILKRWVGIDYGQSNATVFVLAGLGSDNRLYLLDEYYHSGRTSDIQKSPKRYSKDYRKWLIRNGVDGVPVLREKVFIDPSAKGFMLQLYEDGERHVFQADNEVLAGIELVSSIIDADMIRVLSRCKNTLKEFGAYRWDPKAQERGEDKPIKQDDHCMDAVRYIVNGTRLMWLHFLKHQQEYVQKLDIVKENRI